MDPQPAQPAQPQQWAPPPLPPSGWGTPAGGGMGGYPVDVRFSEGPINRLWGIPILGFFVREILLILHFIIVGFLGIAVALVFIVSWIPVLLSGRQGGFVYTIVGGYLRYFVRIFSYLCLLAGHWPPFSLSDVPGEDSSLMIDENQSINRLWGIPFLGLWVRAIILIPHFIVLWLLGVVAVILTLVSWIPVLLNGRQAALVYTFVGGFVRYYARVYAYLTLLSGPYPPFRLGS